MAFQQLYYTSCEHGLSGFSGYQFNAVSEGVSAETMRDVEALTGYEPPPSMLYSDAPGDLARCPVNLCHLPGEPSVTACVRYVGRDPSQRFGNYFAHALAGRDLAAGSGDTLAIELWRSPVWTTRLAAGTRLPPLAGPLEAGPLTPAAVERFLRGHPHGGRLPQLLTAVIRALADDRTVLLVDDTSDHVAHWIAAVSYLLPPPVARTLSFATYVAKPERSRLRLVGTVREAGIPAGPELQDGFDVFDLVGDSAPALPATPLARLLDRVGTAAAAAFWSWTADYKDGGERTPGDWYLPAVAAAASGGIALTEDDFAAVIPWLAEAGHLDGPLRAEVAGHVYQQGRFSDEQLRALSRAADDGDDDELLEELQGELLDSELRRHMADQPDAPRPVPITSSERERRAAERVRAMLAGAAYDEAARLLLWASDARLRLASDVLRRACGDISDGLLGNLTTRPADPRLAGQLHQLAGSQPAFRERLVLSLADLYPRHPGYFPQVFGELPGELLAETDLAGHPELHAGYLIARAERDPDSRAELLPRVLTVTGTRLLAGSLLKSLWRNGRWTHRQALDVARMLPDDLRLDDAARDWFSAAVLRGPDSEAELTDCLTLCRRLNGPGRDDWLTADAGECLTELLVLADFFTTRQPCRSGTLLDILHRPWPVRWRSLHDLLRRHTPTAAARCRAAPTDIPPLLREMGYETSLSYLRLVREELPKQSPLAAMAHAEGLFAARRVLDERQWELVLLALRALPAHWQAEEVERFAHRMRPYSERYAGRLRALAEDKRLNPVRRLARKLPWRKDECGNGNGKDHGSGREGRRGGG
jgi:GTPase-associated protein 1